MAKFTVSVGVPLPPAEAFAHAEDLARFKEWLTIHRVWRSKLPEKVEKGTVVESIVSVKGMANRVRWTIVNIKAPRAMTLDGDGEGGVKIKLIARIVPDGAGSVLTMAVHLGGIALFGPLGMIVAAAVKGEVERSLDNFVELFARG